MLVRRGGEYQPAHDHRVVLHKTTSVVERSHASKTCVHEPDRPPRMLSEMNTVRRWGDWTVQDDEDRTEHLLRMTDAQWNEYAKRAITGNRGRGDLRPVLNWIDATEARRAEARAVAPTQVAPPKNMSPNAVMFRVWKDMASEPSKYGDDDWEEWVAMDKQLRSGPGRWRIEAFWNEQEEMEAPRRLAYYATRIQAAWRGHQVRDTQIGLSCEDCLARTLSPQRWGGEHLCVGCWEHRHERFTDFVQPVVPRTAVPMAEPDENGNVPCEGCGGVSCYVGDYGEYRPGWWCSRSCAYEV